MGFERAELFCSLSESPCGKPETSHPPNYIEEVRPPKVS